MSGITFVLGCPGSGKSTLALEIVKERAAADGKPILVIDPQRVETFKAIPHQPSVGAAIRHLYGFYTDDENPVHIPAKHTAYTPENVADFERLFKGVRAAGQAGAGVHVLVDEARFFMNGRTVPPAFDLFARVYRHALSTVVATSQSYQDAGRPVKAVVGEWRIGRMTAPADLEALKSDLGLDPAEIATLPQWTFKTVKVGF